MCMWSGAAIERRAGALRLVPARAVWCTSCMDVRNINTNARMLFSSPSFTSRSRPHPTFRNDSGKKEGRAAQSHIVHERSTITNHEGYSHPLVHDYTNRVFRNDAGKKEGRRWPQPVLPENCAWSRQRYLQVSRWVGLSVGQLV